MGDKEQEAIQRIRLASEMSLHYYGLPLVFTDSGGKDSAVCLTLARRSGVPFEVMHNHTTADAPETVYFVREQFKRLESEGIKCTINMPIYKGEPVTMWNLIPQKLMPPTRAIRYCCSIFKERAAAGRFIATGIRWAESVKRKSNRGIYEMLANNPTKRVILNNDNDDHRRLLFETCTLKAKRVCNPIIDWSDMDVWDFIESEKIPVNALYQYGFKRVGCIGCPMAGKTRQMEFRRYPTYKKAYINSFDRMLKERIKRGKSNYSWVTGEDVFHWWMELDVLPGQILFEEYEYGTD